MGGDGDELLHEGLFRSCPAALVAHATEDEFRALGLLGCEGTGCVWAWDGDAHADELVNLLFELLDRGRVAHVVYGVGEEIACMLERPERVRPSNGDGGRRKICIKEVFGNGVGGGEGGAC